MQLKSLFDDDTAVSPVIGVILMVAITVILAAVIGTFVLGLGDSIGENAPSATYDWDQTATNGDTYNVTVTHQSGENINPARLSVTGDADVPQGNINESTWGDPISSGDSMTIGDTGNGADVGDNDLAQDDEVRIIWTASGGGSSSTLTTYTVN